MEHVDNDFKVLEEFYRVLMPESTNLAMPIDWNNPMTEEDRSISDPLERERLYCK